MVESDCFLGHCYIFALCAGTSSDSLLLMMLCEDWIMCCCFDNVGNVHFCKPQIWSWKMEFFMINLKWYAVTDPVRFSHKNTQGSENIMFYIPWFCRHRQGWKMSPHHNKNIYSHFMLTGVEIPPHAVVSGWEVTPAPSCPPLDMKLNM